VRKADFVFGIVVCLAGVGALILALQMRAFAGGIPGPGFFPVLVSSGLAVLGAILAWQSLQARGIEVRAVGPVSAVEARHRHLSTDDQGGPSFLRTVAVWCGYVAMVPLLYFLGFTLTMMLLMAYLLFIVEGRRTVATAVAVIVVPAAVYSLFADLLQIDLPSGMLHLGVLGI
jgi:hypothetical protein